MNENEKTMLVDAGILLSMLAISFGIWFYPWITMVALALLLLGGYLSGKSPGTNQTVAKVSRGPI